MYELPASHPLHTGTASSPLVRALEGERGDRFPVWFMRQAGRSLPEYRELRSQGSMLETCLDPELATEITLQPVRRHDVDAAIFFSDIVVPLKLAGVDVEIAPGRGPVFAHPARSASDVARLREEHPVERLREGMRPIRDAVGRIVAELGPRPLLGFAGAPFTLAAYLVEGAPSRDHLRARALMHTDPEAWHALLEWVAELSGEFLSAQVRAGASGVQLFDSWAGSLGAADYRAHAAPSSASALASVRELRYRPAATPGAAAEPADEAARRVPVIHFGVGSAHLLEEFAALDPDALGIDWRTPLDEASRRLGDRLPLQGNVDPAVLFAPEAALERHLDEVLDRGRRAPAHIVNLGHGVPPETDPATLTRLVELIHARDAR